MSVRHSPTRSTALLSHLCLVLVQYLVTLWFEALRCLLCAAVGLHYEAHRIWTLRPRSYLEAHPPHYIRAREDLATLLAQEERMVCIFVVELSDNLKKGG